MHLTRGHLKPGMLCGNHASYHLIVKFQPSTLTRLPCTPTRAIGWESVLDKDPLEFQLPPIHMDYDPSRCDQQIETHILGAQCIGLDIEWRPTGRFFNGTGRPALLQLSTPDNVVLVPLAHLNKPLHSLKKLLMDKRCFAVGVEVLGDVLKLSKEGEELGVRCVDIAKAGTKGGVLAARPGLAGLISEMGGPALSKPKNVQMSDWEARNLSDKQIEYASLDAYASGWGAVRVFKSIVKKSDSQGLSFVSWMEEVAKDQAKEAAEREAMNKKLMSSAGDALSGGAWMDYSLFSSIVIEQCQAEIAASSKDPKYAIANFVSKLERKRLVEVSTPVAVVGSEVEQSLAVKKIRRSPGRRW